MNTLIILEGSKYHSCGNVVVVGSDWLKSNDLRMAICCSEISNIYIKEPIDFGLFKYCLTRLRGKEQPIDDGLKDTYGVFVDRYSMWIGRDKVWTAGDIIDINMIESKYVDYWSSRISLADVLENMRK